MDPRAETVANSFGPRKVCGNSTSNEFHCGKTGPRADLAQWPDHYKLQGPLYGVTQYGVLQILFRTASRILGTTKKWYRLQPSMSIPSECLIALTVPVERSTKANSQNGQTSLPGIIFIPTEMTSILAGAQPMGLSTTSRISSQSSNGRCTIRS